MFRLKVRKILITVWLLSGLLLEVCVAQSLVEIWSRDLESKQPVARSRSLLVSDGSLIECRDGRVIRKLAGSLHALSPSGKLLAYQSQEGVSLVHIASGKSRTFPVRARELRVTEDCLLVFTVDWMLKVYSTADGKAILDTPIPKEEEPIFFDCFGVSGDKVLINLEHGSGSTRELRVGLKDGQLERGVWNYSEGRCLMSLSSDGLFELRQFISPPGDGCTLVVNQAGEELLRKPSVEMGVVLDHHRGALLLLKRTVRDQSLLVWSGEKSTPYNLGNESVLDAWFVTDNLVGVLTEARIRVFKLGSLSDQGSSD